jgi:hypothetical protein
MPAEQPATRRLTMFDLIMLAIGCASFAVLVLYTYACDRM